MSNQPEFVANEPISTLVQDDGFGPPQQPAPFRPPQLDRADLSWAATVAAVFTGLTILFGGLLLGLFVATDDSGGSGSSDDPSIIRQIALYGTVLWTSHANISAGGQVSTADATLPLTLPTLVGLVVIAVTSFRMARRLPPINAKQTWTRIALSTAGSLVVLGAIGLVGRISWPLYGEQVVLSALGFGAFVRTGTALALAQAVGHTLASPIGRRARLLGGERLGAVVERFAASLAIAGWHVAGWTVFAAIAVPLLWLLTAREDVPVWVAFLLWTVGPMALASTGSFSGVEVAVDGSGGLFGLSLASLTQFVSDQGTYSVLNPAMPAAAWLTVVGGVILVALLAARLTALRGSTQVDLPAAAATVATLGVAWTLVWWFTGGASAAGTFAGMSVSGRVGVPALALLFLAGTGIVVEAVHVLIGGRLLATIPSLGRVPVPTPQPFGALDWPEDTWQATSESAMAANPVTSDLPNSAFARDGLPGGTPPARAPHSNHRPATPSQSAPMAAPTPLGRGWLIGAVAVLLVIVLAVAVPAVATTVNNQRHGPEALATQFLDALVAGDVATAIELGHPNVPTGGRVLMTNEIYGQAVRPSSARVLKVSDEGDTAQIEAQYVLDGETIPWTLSARRTGTRMGLLPVWELTPIELPVVSVEVGSSTMRVGKHDLKLKELPEAATYSSDSGTYTLSAPAFPGTYAFSGPNDKFRASEPVTVDATPSTKSWEKIYTPYPTRVEVNWTAAYYDEANAQIKAKIDACVDDYKANRPCPFYPKYYLGEMGDHGKVTMSVKSYPKLEETYSGWSAVSGGVVVEKYEPRPWPQSSGTSQNNRVDEHNWDITIDVDKLTVAYVGEDG